MRVCINQGFSEDFPIRLLPVLFFRDFIGKHFPDEATAIGQEIGIVVFAYGKSRPQLSVYLESRPPTYKLSVGIEKQYIQIIDDVFDTLYENKIPVGVLYTNLSNDNDESIIKVFFIYI